jgi:hypothetical protein
VYSSVGRGKVYGKDIYISLTKLGVRAACRVVLVLGAAVQGVEDFVPSRSVRLVRCPA